MENVISMPKTVTQDIYNPENLPLEDLIIFDPINEIQARVPYFFNKEGFLCVSMETSVIVGDYYGEFNNGDPYIANSLVEWADNQGGYWEWENSGVIIFLK